MNYLTVKEAAEKWNVSEDTVKRLCMEGKIPQADKQTYWLVPESAEMPTQSTEESEHGQEHHHHHHHHHHDSHHYEDDPEYRQKVLLTKLPKQFMRMAILTVGGSVLLQLLSHWNMYAFLGNQQLAYMVVHILALLVYIYCMFRFARKFRHHVRGSRNNYIGNLGAYSLLAAASVVLWIFLQDADYDWVFYLTAIFGRMDAPREIHSFAPMIPFHVLSYIILGAEPVIAHYRHVLRKRKHAKKKS